MMPLATPLGAGYRIDPSTVRDLAPDVIGPDGRLRVMPAAYYAATTVQERALLGHRHGIYLLPTVELVDALRARIGGRSAIEIGAGNGVLAEALGIPATDSCMQADANIAALYALSGHPTVAYGPNVEALDAQAAVEKYRPQVVLAAWVTHKYSAGRHEAGGNMFGVDEDRLLDHCEEYLFVGNEKVHQGKAIWQTASFQLAYPDYLYSRAVNGSRDFVARWEGRRKGAA
ncbi:MAG: hypothetical protein ACXWVD_00355 [Telluria sp.]